MPIRQLTGTALMLALALLSQSLRLFIPLSPAVSMFLIGTLVSACLVLAAWRYGLQAGIFIACLTPIVAFMQGMLPFVPFVPIVALGSSAYVTVAYVLRHRAPSVCIGLATIVKASTLYGGFYLLFVMMNFPPMVQKAILFSMGWPQLVTGTLGTFLAWILHRRLPIF